MLDVEAESEEHCEDRIHLSREQEEGRIPDRLVYCCPQFTGRLREQIKVQLFDKMDKNDSGDRDASENVRNINTCVRLAGCSISVLHSIVLN